MKIWDIDSGKKGKEAFRERRTDVVEALRIKRIFDEKNQTLVYVSHARDIQNGSAKISMSTVLLYQR